MKRFASHRFLVRALAWVALLLGLALATSSATADFDDVLVAAP